MVITNTAAAYKVRRLSHWLCRLNWLMWTMWTGLSTKSSGLSAGFGQRTHQRLVHTAAGEEQEGGPLHAKPPSVSSPDRCQTWQPLLHADIACSRPDAAREAASDIAVDDCCAARSQSAGWTGCAVCYIAHLQLAEHVEEALADDKAEQQVHAAGHSQACTACLQGIDLQHISRIV